jgi:hypothetical protein
MSSRNGFLLTLAVLCAALLVVAAAQADTVKLKNGRVLKGKVTRFGNGEFVVQVDRSDAAAGQVIVLVESVESIEFDAGGAPASSGGSASERVVTVDPPREYTATGVQLQKGDKVRIHASGEIQFADGRRSGPGGTRDTESWPFPGERFGALMALVGSPNSSTYHVIGESAEFEARADGELFLQVNARSLEGARGAYTARISAPGTTTAAGSTGTTGSSGTGSSTSSTSRQLRYELTVAGDKEWTDTAIEILEGDTLRLSASGTINYTSSKTCGPDGGEREWKDLIRSLPVNDAGRGALVGKMGESGVVKAFLVGAKAEFQAQRHGRLFLGINDNDFSNNQGSFKVVVEIVPANR